MKRTSGYYEGGTCDAVTRKKDPSGYDGEFYACRKRGVHPYLAARPLWNPWLNCEAEGPYRRFLCDQHHAEHLAGQDIQDGSRPHIKKG
jgi:hypothetical protein